MLECDLIIYQRPINVYSYHNNRVYDQTSAGVIRNIQPEARSGDSGIIPGDTVRFNTTTVFGSYVDKNGKAAVHNSNTNNGGSEYTMYRSATLSDLYVLHTGGSDPHHNYTLGTETYTGAINKRPVVVHSLYLDDPENPRNVKTYDSTNQATITDILIDNVLPGDEIGLKQQTMTGTYATAQAGETLTADGKTQKDRLKKLKENVITASTKAELTGNDFGDYFIEKESYSGAICREVLEVRIKNQVKLYGEADIETPWHINSFDANSTSNPKGWLSITGLKGTDKIELKDSFFKLGAFAPDNSTIAFGKQTPVGRYPVTETGITEANLPVLKNYIVCLTAVCSVPERCGKAHPGSVCRQKRKSRRRFLYPRAARNGRRDAGDLCGFGLGNPVHDLAVCQRRKASESVPGADGVCAWQLAVHPALCRVDFRVSSVLSGNSV